MATGSGSDFNLQKISTRELEENLRATIEFGGAVYVAGRRGLGKSVIAKDIIKETGHKEVYLNVSCLERTDGAGYPRLFDTRPDQKYVDYLLPHFYQSLIESDEPCVALLDEVDKADTSLNAPLLEFVQFHTMNGRKLPNLRAVIMTGNLTAEGGQRPILPLLDRAEKYLVEANHSQWLEWGGRTREIHASISAFINDHPDCLFGDVDPGDVFADESPRGWHNASKLINFGEKKHWSNRMMATKVAGCIGKKSGLKYAAYFDHYQILLPIIERIMKGETIRDFENLEQGKQMVAVMIVCARLARMIDEFQEKKANKKLLPKEADYVSKFLKTTDPEMTLIAVRSQIGIDRFLKSGLEDHQGFDEILKSITKRINA